MHFPAHYTHYPCTPDAKSPLPYGYPPQGYKGVPMSYQQLPLLMHLLWIQDVQQLNMSEKQSTPQKLFSQSSPWFYIPDSLSLVSTQIINEIPGSVAERNYKAWQSLELNIAITLPMQALQTGEGLITLRVQKVLMTGENFIWLNHRGWLLEVSSQQGPSPQIVGFSCCTGVNQVAQSGGIIAIASSTVQGGDDSFPTVDNIGPSLLFWKENSGAYQFSLWF